MRGAGGKVDERGWWVTFIILAVLVTPFELPFPRFRELGTRGTQKQNT